MKHANIAIFIPHEGCPNQCSFCNQKKITGQNVAPTANQVFDILENASKNLNTNPQNAQIAFFGGSFTAIDENYMVSLLKVASKFVTDKKFNGIRISTRPDAINSRILDILKGYNVKAIELGAQSMCDDVLKANQRGHTSFDVKFASKLIKDAEFELGLQMMTGLYKSSIENDYYTANEVVKLKPDTIRIYPTVVMKDTELEKLYNGGEYLPPSFEDTVSLCAKLIVLFEQENNIPVIRLGLHDEKILRDNMVAGVFHPAFSEICQSRVLFNKVLNRLKNLNILSGNIIIKINPSDVSKFIGQRRANLSRFCELGYSIKLKQDKSVKENEFLIEI
ncbi:MAG: hypothetical protein RUMPE_00726 [Eubacteriales bacterium SKADARSKE-1]|nr:hypothetical protein [Eubacteriales bacterium SKADARSKE-1]